MQYVFIIVLCLLTLDWNGAKMYLRHIRQSYK